MRARLTNAFRMQFSEKYFRNGHRLYQSMLMRMLRVSDGGVGGRWQYYRESPNCTALIIISPRGNCDHHSFAIDHY